MQLFPILLVAALMAVDGNALRPIGADWGLGHRLVALLTCGSIALTLLAMMLAMWWCDRRLVRGDVRAIMAADRIGRSLRMVIIVAFLAAVLVLDWLGAVRAVVRDLVIIDELIALTPALIGLIGIWWLYFPIERRLHQASLIRQLDEGRPVYPAPSRLGYVTLQVRMQLLLTLVPVLLIAAISEAIADAAKWRGLPASSRWMIDAGKIAAAAGVFLFAPLLARVMLDVTPLPLGEMRAKLMEICARHRVKIRELLVWNTNGSVFNAAVMGLIGPLRYVMITDALLEAMDEDQVRAVMAHEIGHVRRHHMPWMVVCLLACFTVVQYAIELPYIAMHNAEWMVPAPSDGVLVGLGSLELIGAFALFGWVCRRFERQADTFAVHHLSIDDLRLTIDELQQPRLNESRGSDVESAAARAIGSRLIDRQSPSLTITSQSVHTMCSALDSIARLNMIDHDRPSWRHGSIAWRMEYLVSIIGLPAKNLPIDRQVRWLKAAAAVILFLATAHAIFAYLQWGYVPS